MENQKTWLDEEAKNLTTPKDYEKLPSLKLVPNVVTEVTIDFSKPFDTWVGNDQKGQPITKKIIPVVLNGTKLVWWLNVKNPMYREVITIGQKGQTNIKVLQTGTAANTKYVLVK